MTSPNDPGQQRPFLQQQSEPFYQTGEFRRAVALMGLLVLFGLGGWFVLSQRAADVAEQARIAQNHKAAEALMPDHPLTSEERDARRVALLSKLEGALADSENGDPLTKQTPGYWKLLEIVSRYTDEELAARAKLDFDRYLVMKDPDAWRGEFVRVRGILQQMDAIRLERPVAGRTDAYRTILTDYGRNVEKPDEEDFVFWFVDLPERPTGVREGDAVDVEAIVNRTASTTSRAGEAHVDPLLVGRHMRRVPARVEQGLHAFLREHSLLIFACMAFLVFGSLLLFSVMRRGRKYARPAAAASAGSFQELFDKKLREAGKVPPPRR